MATTTYDTGDEIRADDFDPLFTDTSVEDDQDNQDVETEDFNDEPVPYDDNKED